MTLPVSVVMVTWNSASVLPAALDALAASAPPPCEVVVVDNASIDRSVDLVRDRLTPGPIHLIVRQEATNTGFASAANRGIELATQPYVFLHNPDLRLLPGTLNILVEALDRVNEDVAAVGPKLFRAEGDDLAPTVIIDSTGIVMTRDGRHFDRGSGEIDRGQYDGDTDVFGLTGAAVMFRHQTLLDSRVENEIFDEDFFAYREDVDLAWRLRGFGFRATYVPEAVAYHRRTVTPERRRRLSSAVNMHSVKNRFLLRVHHADADWLLRFGIPAGLRDALVIGACVTIERSSLPAFPWLWRHRHRHLHRRRTILRRRRVSSAALRSWFR
jgi:GT2 family glycosyltransferase